MILDHRPFESMTEQEKAQTKKRLREETEDLVGQMGDENEIKGAKASMEYVKLQDEKTAALARLDLDMLRMFAKNRPEYFRALGKLTQRFLKEEMIPKKYPVEIVLDDIGVGIYLKGTTLYRAFRVSGDPFFDRNACKMLAVQTGNTVGKMEGYFNETPSGIIVSDNPKTDLAIVLGKYGRNNES